MNNIQKPDQQDNPVAFGTAHADPREGLQTDERNARREGSGRQDDENKIDDEEE